MKRVYEYTLIEAKSPGELSDQVTQAITLNADCQPYGSPFATVVDDTEYYYQAVVYQRGDL